MTKLKVALLQIGACNAGEKAHLAKGKEFCRHAARMGSDIILFPELWNIGYMRYDPQSLSIEQWQSQAVGTDSEFVTEFRELAREMKVAIALTYLEAWNGPPRNAVSLIDRHGEILFTYAKVHTSDHGVTECYCTPGHEFYVGNLQTDTGAVKIGAMICFDREFPESARILMLKGAEIVLTPNACDLFDLQIDQFKTRAFENAMGMAMANYPVRRHNGHSAAYDSDGALLVSAGEHEGIHVAEFDLEKLRRYRASTIWGNSFRRPHRYHLLSSTDVEPPFQRDNGLGRPFDRASR